MLSLPCDNHLALASDPAVCLSLRISCELSLIPVPLSLRSLMRDVYRDNIVQITAKCFRPPVFSLWEFLYHPFEIVQEQKDVLFSFWLRALRLWL